MLSETTTHDQVKVNKRQNGNSSDDKKSTTKKLTQTQKLKAEIESLKAEIDSLKDKYLRLLAEFDNFRKRKAAENELFAFQIKREFLLNLLPILDDTDRLLQHQEQNNDSIIAGIKLIADKFGKTLSDFGVTPIDAKGKLFNPELHEAILTVDSDQAESGAIIQVHEPGYMLGDKILRHAKVIVTK